MQTDRRVLLLLELILLGRCRGTKWMYFFYLVDNGPLSFKLTLDLNCDFLVVPYKTLHAHEEEFMRASRDHFSSLLLVAFDMLFDFFSCI